VYGINASGDQLKQKLDNLSDVSDNVRDRGTSLIAARHKDSLSFINASISHLTEKSMSHLVLS